MHQTPNGYRPCCSRLTCCWIWSTEACTHVMCVHMHAYVYGHVRACTLAHVVRNDARAEGTDGLVSWEACMLCVCMCVSLHSSVQKQG